MKQVIERLEILVKDARTQYNEELAGGGDPVWPEWVDDVASLLRRNRALEMAGKNTAKEPVEY